MRTSVHCGKQVASFADAWKDGVKVLLYLVECKCTGTLETLNPFIKFHFENKIVFVSSTKKNTLEPQFGEFFFHSLENLKQCEFITVELFNQKSEFRFDVVSFSLHTRSCS